MSDDTRPNDLLLLAGKVLCVFMQIACALGAIALLCAMPVIFIFHADIAAEIAGEAGTQVADFPLWPAIGVMLLALVAVVMIFFFFGKLRQIIATVGKGDPFAPENATRLGVMAWLLLAIQIIGIPIAGIGLLVSKWADEIENANITIDAGLDLTGILMVVILFILARVFRHGAAMREDLKGTV